MSTDFTSTEYTIISYTSAGAIVGYITDFSELAVGLVTNGYSTFQMSVLYASPSAAYLEEGSILLVYRANPLVGVVSQVIFGGTIVKTVLVEAEITTLTVTAFGFEELLGRRIIAYKDNARGKVVFPQSKAAGFEYASSIIRKIINSNIGSGATSTREDLTNLVGTARTINGVMAEFNDITDTSDFGLAISSYDGIARQNLLTTIQEVAQEGKIGFEMVWDSSTNTYSFNMRAFRIGDDRSDTVKFSIGNGTVERIETTSDYAQAWNVAIMNGGGKDAGERRFTYPPYGSHPTGKEQREVYLVSATGKPAGNRATAISEYQKMQKSITQVTCTVQQAAGLVFGRDYFIGDLVSVQTSFTTLKLQVKQVTLSMSSDGVETIGVTLESE